MAVADEAEIAKVIDDLPDAAKVEARQVADEVLPKPPESPTIDAPVQATDIPETPVKPPTAPKTAPETPPAADVPEVPGTPKLEEPKPSTKKVPGERSFPKTLEKNELEGGNDRFYQVYGDEPAVKKASERIAADAEDARRFVLGSENKPLTKDQVTTGTLLLQKYKREIAAAASESEKLTLAEKQVEIAENLSRRLTESGQAIQAASIVGRLSPEGVLLTAQRRVNQINKGRRAAQQIKLTGEQTKQIMEKAIKAETLEGFTEQGKELVGVIDRIGKKTASTDDIKKLGKFVEDLQNQYGLNKPKVSKSPKKARLTAFMDEQEAAAIKRLKDRGYNVSAGVDPGALADFAIVGANRMSKTGKKFLKWSDEMVATFGEDIRPHLKKIFKESESILVSSRRKINEAEKLGAGLKKLMREMEASTDVAQPDLDTLQELMENINKYSGDARDEVLLELQQFIGDLKPPTVGRRLATAQTVAQLLNPKTMIRNVLGNEIFYRMERLNRYVASVIDIGASKLTGTRSVTFRKAGQGGYWEGWLRGAKHGWKGLNPEGLTTQFDISDLH